MKLRPFLFALAVAGTSVGSAEARAPFVGGGAPVAQSCVNGVIAPKASKSRCIGGSEDRRTGKASGKHPRLRQIGKVAQQL